MKWWTIYALVDPETKVVRYVGYTHHSVDERLKYHDWDARRKGPHGQTKKAKWLSGLKRRLLKPEVAILQVGQGDWAAAEQFWIASFENAGTELLNMTVGGRGVKKAA